jgi:hypothetical protein
VKICLGRRSRGSGEEAGNEGTEWLLRFGFEREGLWVCCRLLRGRRKSKGRGDVCEGCSGVWVCGGLDYGRLSLVEGEEAGNEGCVRVLLPQLRGKRGSWLRFFFRKRGGPLPLGFGRDE